MVRPTKSGPKTQTKNTSKRSLRKASAVGLGDTFGTSDEDSLNATGQNSDDFQTPSVDEELTDYDLEFTSNHLRKLSPRRSSTLQTHQPNTSSNTTARAGVSIDKTSNVTAKEKAKTASTITETNNRQTELTAETAAPGRPGTSNNTERRRKQLKPAQREARFHRLVVKLQSESKLLVPRLPFSRLVREIMCDMSHNSFRVTATALEALQTSAEMYLTQRLQDAYLLTLHRGRLTLEVKDLKLVEILKGVWCS